MDLREIFNSWAFEKQNRFIHKQWLLSKWEVINGIEWPREKIDLMTNGIRNKLALTSGDGMLLDVGCGGGWISQTLEPHVRKILGVDISLGMLRRAREFLTECQSPFADNLVCGEAALLPFKENTFARVLCYFVLINVVDENYTRQAIMDIMRVLKKEGRAVIGQLPDRAQSKDYDEAKENYLAYCRQTFNLGANYRDKCYVPIHLFDVPKLKEFLKQENISFEFEEAFNPFYYPGQPETVPWRLDLILTKN